MMMQDKQMKKDILKEILSKLSADVSENDLKPIMNKKTKIIIQAEGDSPEEVKQEIMDKLENIPEDEMDMEKGMMGKMMGKSSECSECGGEGCPECEDTEEEEPDYMSELPESLRKALMKKLSK